MVEEQNFSIWRNIGSSPDLAKGSKKQTLFAAAAGAAADWIYCFFDFSWKFGMALLRLFDQKMAGGKNLKKIENSDIEPEAVDLSSAKLSFRKETEESDVSELRALRGSGFEGPARS